MYTHTHPHTQTYTQTHTHTHTHTHTPTHTPTHTHTHMHTNTHTPHTPTHTHTHTLKNRKKHSYLIEKIRKQATELERNNCKIEFRWIKAHAGHYGDELVDQLAKEAASENDITECYRRIPKSEVLSELNEVSVTKWQS